MAIENTYLLGKNITLGCGFDLQAKAPLDSRQTVPAFVGLQALIDGNAAYEGMIVYDEETKKTYQAQIIDGALKFREFGLTQAELEDIIGSTTTAAMEFKGVVTSLPASGGKGDMYKVSAAFDVAAANDAQGEGFSAKIGDSIVCEGNDKWFLIPSGDDIEDTWRPVTGVNNDSALTFKAGDKLEVTTAADGTITYKHVAIDAPTIVAENEQTRTYITELVTDGHGHVTGVKTATENVVDTDTTYDFEGQSEEATSVYFQVTSSEEGASTEVIYLDAYSKNETNNLLNGKVDKATGKSLIADTEIARLSGMSTGANKTEASTSNGYIKIDGAETKVYELDAAEVAKVTETIKDIKVENADHADAATKVDQKLTIKVGGSNVEFDGSTAKTADVDAAIKTAIDAIPDYTGNAGTTVTTTVEDGVIKAEVNNGSIGATQLDDAVKASLAKADSALQAHQNISHLATKEEVNTVASNAASALSTARTDITKEIGDAISAEVTRADGKYETKGTAYAKNETYTKTEVDTAIEDAIEAIPAYTGKDGTTVKVTVTNGEIGAEVKEGTIANKHIASNAAIAKSKLAEDVQASLSKADSALQTHQDISHLAVAATVAKNLEDAIATEITRADKAYDAAGTAAAKVKELAEGQVTTNTNAIATLNGDATKAGSVANSIKTAIDNANLSQYAKTADLGTLATKNDITASLVTDFATEVAKVKVNTATTADKVGHSLTITANGTNTVFNGSEAKSVDVDGAIAAKITAENLGQYAKTADLKALAYKDNITASLVSDFATEVAKVKVNAATAADSATNDSAGNKIVDTYAVKATTLAGYGITNAYAKTETYTQAQVDALVANAITWGSF